MTLLLLISSLLHVILTTTTLLEVLEKDRKKERKHKKGRSRQVPGSFLSKIKISHCDSLLGLADIVTRQHPCRDDGCNHAREKRKKKQKTLRDLV